ncbi:hypothetical protein [Flavobacterium eburneipallidum]|uniref:hypothetical protein n=1 Tax=Flavobacterium eburneipallidum TaxID=3003263 RepID=UPI002482EFC7|nr:hypothetical protein [Flavobacterium eburneipallidum]
MQERAKPIMKYLIFFLIVINFILTYLEIKDIDIAYQSSNNRVLQFRFVLPIVICTLILIFLKNLAEKLLVKTFFSIPFLILGTNWFVIFSFTSYRKHFKYEMIVLSIVFLMLFVILNNNFFNLFWTKKRK